MPLHTLHPQTPKQEDNVGSPSVAYGAMLPRWDKIDALMGGTEVMRKFGRKYLPDFEGEENPQYQERLDRSFLIPATSDTIGMAVSKPFSKPVTLSSKDTLPDVFDEISNDADLGGRSLHAFARDVHEDAVRHGKTHVLVEMPVNPNRTIDKRPYFVHYKARDVFAWRSDKNEDTGERELTHVRMFEHVTKPVGEWGEETVLRIRVIDAPLTKDVLGRRVKTTVRLFEEKTSDGKKTWEEIGGGPVPIDFPGIPLVTIYHNRTGFFVAVPPFDKLASLNIEHWQSASDQKNILHVARVPILVEEGVESEDQRKIGSGQRIQIPLDAKVYYAEHTGAAIAAGQTDLDKIEERMADAGHQINVKRIRPSATATGENIEEQKETSELQEWIMATSGGFFSAFEMVVIWEKLSGNRAITVPDDFEVLIFSDFAVSQDPQDAVWLLNAVNAARITPRTFLKESVRRGALSETTDIDEELEELEAMGPPLGMIGLDDPPDPDPDPDPEPEPDPEPDE